MFSRVILLKSILPTFKRCAVVTKSSNPVIMGRQFSAFVEPYKILINESDIKHEFDEMVKIFPDVVNDIVKIAETVSNKKTADRLARAIYYNVPTDTNIALTTVIAYKGIVNKKYQTEEDLNAVRLLGWCSDMILSSFAVCDDIMDKCLIRRNKKCWYLLDDVRHAASNDIIMLENAGFMLLKKYFQHLPNYAKLVDVFHKNNFSVTVAQTQLHYGISEGIEKVSMDDLKRIYWHICSYPCFYTVIESVMVLTGRTDQIVLSQIEDICIDIGEFYQFLNDYLDFYDDTGFLRKQSTDIRDGKFSWLITTAMERATSDQRNILIENYGKDDDAAVAKVSNVYKEMNLHLVFKEYKRTQFKMVEEKIQNSCPGVPRQLLSELLHLGIYFARAFDENVVGVPK